MSGTRAELITTYAETLDTGTLARDLLNLGGDWRSLTEEDKVLRRVLIGVLCDRYAAVSAAFQGYDMDSRHLAVMALRIHEGERR